MLQKDLLAQLQGGLSKINLCLVGSDFPLFRIKSGWQAILNGRSHHTIACLIYYDYVRSLITIILSRETLFSFHRWRFWIGAIVWGWGAFFSVGLIGRSHG